MSNGHRKDETPEDQFRHHDVAYDRTDLGDARFT